MLAQVQLLPDQASTHAPRVDALFFTLMGVCGFITLVIAILIITFAIKYRRKSEDYLPPHIEGSTRLEIAWTVGPLLVGIGFFIWGASLFFAQARPPEDAMEIYVVAKQWMWKLQHPDGQREINELHVPADQPVRLTMVSEDVIHSFYVPAFRIKQDVLPGRYSALWFQATQPGRYRLFCAEYCGTAHSKMGGWVVVMKPDEYKAWLSERAEGSPALEGGKLFRKLKCISCHNRGESVAPLLENLYGSPVRLDDGRTVIADRAYLRESILDPRAKVVAGYQPVMPSFQGQVSEEEILQLVAFIRSLGPGDTPSRVEKTEPPLQDPRPSKEGQRQP